MPPLHLLGQPWLVSLAGSGRCAECRELRCHCAMSALWSLGLSVGAAFDHNAVDAMLPRLAICGDGGCWFGRLLCSGRWLFHGFSALTDARTAWRHGSRNIFSFAWRWRPKGGDKRGPYRRQRSRPAVVLELVVPFVALAMGVDLGGPSYPTAL